MSRRLTNMYVFLSIHRRTVKKKLVKKIETMEMKKDEKQLKKKLVDLKLYI